MNDHRLVIATIFCIQVLCKVLLSMNENAVTIKLSYEIN